MLQELQETREKFELGLGEARFYHALAQQAQNLTADGEPAGLGWGRQAQSVCAGLAQQARLLAAWRALLLLGSKRSCCEPAPVGLRTVLRCCPPARATSCAFLSTTLLRCAPLGALSGWAALCGDGERAAGHGAASGRRQPAGCGGAQVGCWGWLLLYLV